MSTEYYATLIVPCFDQEPYIRQSLESVLQQDCPPSQILIGDDCSNDRIFETVQEIAAGYQGRHVVRAHRNDRNLGSGNVLKLAETASAQHVVVFHGDDIAMADRATRLVETMQGTGASLVCSNARLIDEAGEPYGHLIADEPSGFLEIEQMAADWSRKQTGSSHAFDRRIVADFLGWAADAYWFAGDHVLPFRASLVGGAYYLDEVLLARRQHPGNQGREVKARLNNRLTPLMAKEVSQARFLTTRAFMLRDLDAYAEKTGETEATRRGARSPETRDRRADGRVVEMPHPIAQREEPATLGFAGRVHERRRRSLGTDSGRRPRKGIRPQGARGFETPCDVLAASCARIPSRPVRPWRTERHAGPARHRPWQTPSEPTGQGPEPRYPFAAARRRALLRW